MSMQTLNLTKRRPSGYEPDELTTKIFLFLTSFLFLTTAYADFVPEKDVQTYYKKSYEESRLQFLNSVESFKKLNQVSIQQQAFSDPEDKNLTTDTALIQTNTNKKTSENLIVVMSGLHGIEGYVGSALQSGLIEQNLSSDTTNKDFLFIHALNPYGFRNNRRVNRKNIDLNRNFMVNDEDYKLKNPAYAEIDSFLNPKEPVTVHFFSRYSFILSAVKLILQYSLETLREAILKGQYEFDKGLYYGGQDHQYQKQVIDELNQKLLSQYKKVFALDLHTGYGQKNKLHILANSMTQPSAKQLNSIFGEDRIDYGDKKKFYKTTGDLITYFESKSTPQTEIIGATFEFGTLDSQKTLGSIESLRRMVLENQNYHFPADTLTADYVNSLFQDMFYPQDLEFRQAVFDQAKIEFAKIKSNYK